MQNEWSRRSYRQSELANGPTLTREDRLRAELSDQGHELALAQERIMELKALMSAAVQHVSGELREAFVNAITSKQ